MKIEKLVLLTGDLKQTRHFYSEVFNLEIVSEETDCISFKAGRTVLIFKSTSVLHPVYHVAFNISNNKIIEASQWCEQRGLALLPFENNKIIDFPNWNAKSIYFFDNTGNILEFIARFDLKNGRDSPFDSTQILSVSEIGMVVNDVNEFCGYATGKYGIPIYQKQQPSPHFSVIGDAEGLLIVVPRKRKWFPTEIVSDKFPLEMVLEQSGIKYQLRY